VTARIVVTGVAVLALLAGIVLLERPRAGLEISHLRAGQTPGHGDAGSRAPIGPLVVIAHGFAGSRQLMAAWQLTLAQAGYVTASFDFEGHGRNPVPMSGDVTSIDGTTQLLMDEIGRVTDTVLEATGAAPRVALLGHSMASDIVVRQGIRDERVEAIVGISLFSQAVTEDEPHEPPDHQRRAGGHAAGGRAGGHGPPRRGRRRNRRHPRRRVRAARGGVALVEHVGVLYAADRPAGGARMARPKLWRSVTERRAGRGHRSRDPAGAVRCRPAGARAVAAIARRVPRRITGTGGSSRSRRFRPSHAA
jgi:hypothetical protein